ncbi:MAG: phosphotransferase [Anaerolineae bacterium]|nr:phosphotransferase [Anaerolineae bacterium]
MSRSVVIPQAFAKRMVEMNGADGQAWMAHLPQMINQLAEQWQLTILPPFKLSYNYVAPVTRADGTTAVLKIGYPSPELLTEMAALRWYNGRSACHLLDSSPTHYAMLLEQIQPGQPLWSLEDDEAETGIAAHLMQQLWQPIPPEDQPIFPTLEKWTQALLWLSDYFEDGFGPFPRRLVETAVSLRAELLADNIPPRLLHGDFHHENVLAAQRQPWLALDPKGVIGDPAYEVGAYLYNPNTENILAQNLVARRIDQFSEILQIDRQRLISWGIVQAVLSAVWSYEDHRETQSATLRVADKLITML